MVDDEADLQDVVDDLTREWNGRVQVRLLGPLAAYDFVVTHQSAG